MHIHCNCILWNSVSMKNHQNEINFKRSFIIWGPTKHALTTWNVRGTVTVHIIVDVLVPKKKRHHTIDFCCIVYGRGKICTIRRAKDRDVTETKTYYPCIAKYLLCAGFSLYVHAGDEKAGCYVIHYYFLLLCLIHNLPLVWRVYVYPL